MGGVSSNQMLFGRLEFVLKHPLLAEQSAVMYRIKLEELYILGCGKGRGRRPRPFLQLKM